MTDERLGPRGSAGAATRMAAALAGRPFTVARRGAGLATELVRIGLGRSRLAPAPDDPRYADPAWREHPLLRRTLQVHLAASATARHLVEDARLDPVDGDRVWAALSAVADVLAPSNTPLNPAVWRAALDAADDTGAAAESDVPVPEQQTDIPPTPPVTTRPAGFEVGTDVAATPGAVVLRTPVFELLQYLPQTETVRDVPLVVVPPLRNRYYLADLAPRRSMVEHLVRAGQQVFAVSWHNPDATQAGCGLGTYGQAVLDAMDAAEHIARTPRTALMALGSGGTITAMLLGHLAAIGAQERVACVTLAATVLDQEDARDTADPLAWPGRNPATATMASDVRFWLADTMRVPAGLHHDLTDVVRRGTLTVPEATSLLGTALDLAKVDRDCYVVAGTGDRLAPWADVHRVTRLLGGTSRFVLADGGQVASMLSPPGEPGLAFRAAAPPTGTPPVCGPPNAWIALGATEPGSWWDDHLAWLAERTGPGHDAPPELGGHRMHALAPAPGDYVQG